MKKLKNAIIIILAAMPIMFSCSEDDFFAEEVHEQHVSKLDFDKVKQNSESTKVTKPGFYPEKR